ncbi:MAG: hypothetical protein H6959_08495 [Chromatiaceae bacterium]|nr:hypothetical protein [Gammaproteobacteria bacterium]MCP5422947.1 hypothetical protein [Chromatiaceae bacterium]
MPADGRVRLRLGTVGWERADWLRDYYPADIPDDWRLAYYANDCDCVLIPRALWERGDPSALGAQIDEAPGTLRCFVEVGDVRPRACPLTDRLRPGCDVLLTASPDPGFEHLPQWVADGADAWHDPGSTQRLLRWAALDEDMRAWRARAAALDPRTTALVIDGKRASPARIRELRTLLQLLGRA